MSTAKSALDKGLTAFRNGETFDWKGVRLPAVSLRDALLAATLEDRPRAMILQNATVAGDLVLDELGEVSSPLTLQIVGCNFAGIRARASRWRQLIISKSAAGWIDLARATVDREAVVERCRVSGWLDLTDARIGRSLVLDRSSFASGGRDDAVMLSGAIIGSTFSARGMNSAGCLFAPRIKVEGNVQLGGAQLNGRGKPAPKALDLSRAEIAGQLELVQADRRFVAHGRIHLDAATCGAVIIKAASLDGCGQPAIVGDQLRVRDTLDMSGLTADGGPQLEVSGEMRFGSSTIGNQVQLHDALIDGGEHALMLHNCRVGGDILIGNPGSATLLRGALNANLCVLEARLVVDSVTFEHPEEAISARHARIEKEIICHQVTADGAFRFDNSSAEGLTLEDVDLVRPDMPPVRAGLPEPYSQPEDALLDLNFISLRTDFKLENVTIRNGNVRMISAEIGGGMQMSRITIDAGGRMALVAQAARLTGGFYIAGTPSAPAPINGEVTLIGARIDGDMTISHVALGTIESPANFIMRNTRVESAVLFNASKIHGQINASGARVDGDFHFHSVSLVQPGEVVADLRGAAINGELQWATVRQQEGVSCSIEGHVTVDGAMVGSLSWNRVRLAGDVQLVLTNVQVERRIEAEHLVCDGAARIDLSGTTTPLLVDRLGGEDDGWCDARLGLDNFTYGRLARPSGGNGDDPAVISRRRLAWLERRFDPGSARPARHLATVLREQGLFEASRRILMRAFTDEGDARSSGAGRALGRLFGFFFGHGLSGSRAALSLLAIWTIGTVGVMRLQSLDMLVVAEKDIKSTQSCGPRVDPVLYAGDVMIPLDLGEEARCRIGAGPRANLDPGTKTGFGWTVGGTLETAKAFVVIYRLLAWITLSLAIATWSGLFKRGGRE